MGVCPCGDAHFTESVYDQKTVQASLRLKTKVWIPKKRQSKSIVASIWRQRIITSLKVGYASGLLKRVLITRAKSSLRQRTTPSTTGSGPLRTSSATVASCSGARRGLGPGVMRFAENPVAQGLPIHAAETALPAGGFAIPVHGSISGFASRVDLGRCLGRVPTVSWRLDGAKAPVSTPAALVTGALSC